MILFTVKLNTKKAWHGILLIRIHYIMITLSALSLLFFSSKRKCLNEK